MADNPNLTQSEPIRPWFRIVGIYNDFVLPHVIDLSMRNSELGLHRHRLLPKAHGNVLEIGSGSGLNFSLYTERVDSVVALEPHAKLLQMSHLAAERAPVPIKLVAGSASAIPADSASFDVVLSTWTLCSVPDILSALREMRRVLKHNGELLFIEHGLAPEEEVRRWQNRLTPLWKRIGGGCHLNRPIANLIESAGFRMAVLDAGYARGPKSLAFMYEGQAVKNRQPA